MRHRSDTMINYSVPTLTEKESCSKEYSKSRRDKKRLHLFQLSVTKSQQKFPRVDLPLCTTARQQQFFSLVVSPQIRQQSPAQFSSYRYHGVGPALEENGERRLSGAMSSGGLESIFLSVIIFWKNTVFSLAKKNIIALQSKKMHFFTY